MKLRRDFYIQQDVVQIARELLGKELISFFDGEITSGLITETEAYAGITDKASHAYGGLRTNRTEVMFMEGGAAYVYLCYGMHSLFNVVTHRKDVPHAVLIRAISPKNGLDVMLRRSNKKKTSSDFLCGPGKVTKALGIHYLHSGLDLLGNELWIEDHGQIVPEKEIYIGSRIGVDYAGEDAQLPYRFIWKHFEKENY